MDHPFTKLKPEYTALLAAMVVRPDHQHLVDEVAAKLVASKARYLEVTALDGVPAVYIGPSFEREASNDFTKNPAQGWSLHSRSRDIPHNGPFPDWRSAAIAAYKLNGLDKVGAGNWTWELICFYGELFNGFGYRDYHHMHSPYLWGGTNIQTVGKYTSDGQFDAAHMDTQLGIIPLARRMVQLDPTLALTDVPFVPAPPIASGIAAEPDFDTKAVQTALNTLGFSHPLDVDGSYGNQTKTMVENFQHDYGLHADGLVGPETICGAEEGAGKYGGRSKMITRAQAQQAVDDGLLEAIKDHVKIGVATILSESNDENARQFELGLRKLRDAGVIQHAIVEKTFPE